jgi:SAM-dependent methyltransferase
LDQCGLLPTDRVLDIGSGIGRKTWPLLDYLTNSYEGLDPIERQVKWCKQNITSRYPNFRFQSIDVWSKLYNPTGRTPPSEYRLPFNDGEFDFVMLGSVFTHMFMPDMRHYVSEIRRVLKPGGRGMITYLLLNDESKGLIASGRSSQNLVFPVEEGSKADNPHRFETSVGHSEAAVIRMYDELDITAKVVAYGSWCGRQVPKHYQDVLSVVRR